MWDTLYKHLRPFFQSPDQILNHIEQKVTVLDIGCGYGELCAAIAQQKQSPQVIGIDHDSHKIEVAKKRYAHILNLHFDGTDLGTLSEIKQHTVLIIDVCHYFSHTEQRDLLKKIASSPHVHKIIARDIIKATHPAYYLNRCHEFVMTRTKRTKVSHTQFAFFTKNQWRQMASDINMSITIEKSGLPFYNDHLILFSKD